VQEIRKDDSTPKIPASIGASAFSFFDSPTSFLTMNVNNASLGAINVRQLSVQAGVLLTTFELVECMLETRRASDAPQTLGTASQYVYAHRKSRMSRTTDPPPSVTDTQAAI
jgi:hypothetical protein